MSALETVTIIISSVAIGAAVASLLVLVLFSNLQRRLILRNGDEAKVSDETASVLRLLSDSFRDDVLDNDREVLGALVQRYSQTSLTSVFADSTERSYLFEGLSDASHLPWAADEQQRGERPR